MKTIWKWTLALQGHQTVILPNGAQILSVQMQGERPQLWALCNPDEPVQTREILIIGTGHHIEHGPGRYIGTFQMHDGSLVFHAFELERA